MCLPSSEKLRQAFDKQARIGRILSRGDSFAAGDEKARCRLQSRDDHIAVRATVMRLGWDRMPC
jgi:hypothetical protein